MLPVLFIGYARNSEGSWTGDLIIAIIENSIAFEVYVKSFKSKEVGIKKIVGSRR